MRHWIALYPQLRLIIRRLLQLLPRASTTTVPVDLDSVSAAHTVEQLRESWQDSAIPPLQRKLADQQLAAYRANKPIAVFDVLVNAVRANLATSKKSRLLEIGCSSGYYAEVLQVKGVDVDYVGCDYSDAFIQMARNYYPGLSFDTEDATALKYDDAMFDIVVSGCCLLHIPDYKQAIAETARVTSRIAIFHRTPVHHTLETKMFTKKAYGIPTLEIHFNERELISHFVENGLRITDIVTLSTDWRMGDASAVKTYVCEKVVP